MLKRYSIFLIIGIVILIVLGTIFYSIRSKAPDLTSNNSNPQQSPPPEYTDMTTWKDYSNTAGNFQLRLPGEWNIDESTQSAEPILAGAEFTLPKENLNSHLYTRITVGVIESDAEDFPLSTDKRFQEVLQESVATDTNVPSYKLANTTVSGQPAVQIVSNPEDPVQVPYRVITWTRFNDLNYVIEIVGTKTRVEKLLPAYNLLLSTIQLN